MSHSAHNNSNTLLGAITTILFAWMESFFKLGLDMQLNDWFSIGAHIMAIVVGILTALKLWRDLKLKPRGSDEPAS